MASANYIWCNKEWHHCIIVSNRLCSNLVLHKKLNWFGTIVKVANAIHLLNSHFHEIYLTLLQVFLKKIFATIFSRWWQVDPKHFRNAGSRELIKWLRDFFSMLGVPEEIWSDGGPPFSFNVTRKFLKTVDNTHRITSAYYRRSNDGAESNRSSQI